MLERHPLPWLQENDQKRIRALKKATKERELKRQRMHELAKAKHEMAVLRLEHQRLSSKLQDYSIFNKYLEKVVENSEVSEGGSAFLSPISPSPGPRVMRGLGTLCRDGHYSEDVPPALEGSWEGPLAGVGDQVVYFGVCE